VLVQNFVVHAEIGQDQLGQAFENLCYYLGQRSSPNFQVS
jgi:hypothetical protein